MTQITRTRSRSMKAAAYAPGRSRRKILDSSARMRLDWILLGACALIALLGLVMIYSASRSIVEGDPFYFVKRQTVALLVGVGIRSFLS